MKMKKQAKPLVEATIGDITDRKCGFCGLYLQFAEVDPGEKVAWLSCPTFMAEREFSKNEHSSFSVPLKETGYVEGDENKPHAPLREGVPAERPHHDRPKVVAPPSGPFGKR